MRGSRGVLKAAGRVVLRSGLHRAGEGSGLPGSWCILDAGLILDGVLLLLGGTHLLVRDLRGVIRLPLLLFEQALIGTPLLGGRAGVDRCTMV